MHGFRRQDGPGHGMPRMSEYLRGISLEYSSDELKAATLNWDMSRKLGSGSYGAVYRGELEDGSEVAIKAIDLGALAAQGQNSEMAGFDEEVQMLSKFRHPNLVTLLGWGKERSQRYLVYELLAGGDAFQRLQKSVRKANVEPFHWWERLSVCLDAATGLSHMHNSKPKAFHRDIKSANILLDRHGTAKMADFGLSCTSSGHQGDRHVQVKTISGTPGYACPIYSQTGKVTEGSEVYSLGMVMLELLSGLAPASADPSRPGGIVYPIANSLAPNKPGAYERVVQGTDASAAWPAPLASELARFALRCVHLPDEEQRPRFVEVVRSLRALGERFPKTSVAAVLSYGAQVPAPVMVVSPAQSRAQGAGGYPQQSANSAEPRGAAPNRDVAGMPLSRSPQRKPTPGSRPQTAASWASAVAASSHGGNLGLPASAVEQSTAASVQNAPFVLEIISAENLDINMLAPELRVLPLVPGPVDGEGAGASYTALVGRQSQPDFFEAWLPDMELRNCISRTAFEITWSPGGDGTRLQARGANPVSVDGKIAPREASLPLQQGSEVGFPYSSTGELSLFLLLRFQAARHSPVHEEQHSQMPTASLPGDSKASRAASKSKAGPQGWCLTCVHVEGMAPEEWSALAPRLRDFRVMDGTVLIGRQHQPQSFEALLSRVPGSLSFISRSHVQVEACGSAGIRATNLSSNPVYVDREPLAKGDSRMLSQDQVLSFARLEGREHVLFLSLQVRQSDSSAEGEDGVELDGVSAAARNGTKGTTTKASQIGRAHV